MLKEKGVSKILPTGIIMRITRRELGGYYYPIDYDAKRFIYVRVVSGPDQFGCYACSTRDIATNQHIGPGGGWTGESVLRLLPGDLEPLL